MLRLPRADRNHDVRGRVREKGHPDQAVALIKYKGGLLFSAVRVGARLPKGHKDWKSGTRAEYVTEIREDARLTSADQHSAPVDANGSSHPAGK